MTTVDGRALAAPEWMSISERKAFYDELERDSLYAYGTRGGWTKHPANPVLGEPHGTCFDMSVVAECGGYRMWFSWRPERGIAYSQSDDGVHWSPPQLVLGPVTGSDWESDEVNRPCVVRVGGRLMMWYSGQVRPYQVGGRSAIGLAWSDDGLHWERRDQPVLAAGQKWENEALMCPHVLVDEDESRFRLWYSAGDNHEPHSIGYAESTDGVRWERHTDNPVLVPDPRFAWEQHKVVASHVLREDDWFYMFYVGHVHEERGSIGLARSRDGVTAWEKFPLNPVIAPDRDSWDGLSVYKPYVLRTEDGWILWYNGAHYDAEHWVVEEIGVATLLAPGFLAPGVWDPPIGATG